MSEVRIARMSMLAAMLLATVSVWSAEERRAPVIVVEPAAGAGPVRVEVGGEPGGAVRWVGPGPLQLWNDPFAELVRLLEELNLTPHFNLSMEQKDQIQAIREGVRQAQERWRKEHEAEYRELDEEARRLGQAGGRDVKAWREWAQKRRTIDQTAPRSDDAVKQLMLVLTEEQRQIVETRKAEKQAAAEQERRRMMERWGRMTGQPAAVTTRPAAGTPPPGDAPGR